MKTRHGLHPALESPFPEGRHNDEDIMSDSRRKRIERLHLEAEISWYRDAFAEIKRLHDQEKTSADVWRQQAKQYCDEAYELRLRYGALWIPASERLPEAGKPVIGYADRWVDAEYNEIGMRECFWNEDGWLSSKWNNYQDYWGVEVGPPDYWKPFPSVPTNDVLTEGAP